MLSRRLRRLLVRREQGFTLIELLVAMVLLGVMVTAWSGLLSTTVRSGGRTQELSNLQTEVRAAVDALAADLRQAQCNGTTSPVTAATGTQLTFYSPERLTFYSGGVPTYRLRQVSYQLTNGELNRAFATSTNTGGPPWTIPALGAWANQLGSVANTTVFTYKDANGAATTTPADVASVNVSLTVAPRAGLGGVSTTYQTNINLRTAACS